ncbi:MAG: hypothetical protein V4577_12930 [Bacteroidota bacterium]
MKYLANKVTREADKTFDQTGYAGTIFEKWKQERFRRVSSF